LWPLVLMVYDFLIVSTVIYTLFFQMFK